MGREVNAFWLDFTQAIVPKTTIHSVSCEPYVDSAVVLTQRE